MSNTSHDQSAKKHRYSNCAECRRLKVKCDRQIPCARCVRLKHPELCPNGTRESVKERLQRLDGLTEIAERDANGTIGLQPTLGSHLTYDAGPSSLPELRSIPTTHGIEGPLVSGWRPQEDSWSPSSKLMQQTSPRDQLGTVISVRDDRFTFVGPLAGAQWLRSDVYKLGRLRPPSPPSTLSSDPLDHLDAALGDVQTPPVTYSALSSHLPQRDHAAWLTSSYFRRTAWLGSPITQTDFEAIFNSVYHRQECAFEVTSTDTTAFLQLGLVYALLAMGSVVDMEQPPLSPRVRVFVALSQKALVAGKYLVSNSLTALAALSISCKALTHTRIFQRWDYAWQLWGTAQRLILSMGLHRDGKHWDMDSHTVEQRRLLFWDTYISDVNMSAYWDRMTGFDETHTDTLYPTAWALPNAAFHGLDARIAILTRRCLLLGHSIVPASIKDTMDLWRSILDVEQEIPYRLRCRAAMRVTVSRFAQPAAADAVSPAPEPEDLGLVMQQHHLAIRISSTILRLLRPFFIAAFKMDGDPADTLYGGQFMATLERCSIILACLSSLYSLQPLIVTRYWYLWSEGFTAAACLAAIAVIAPRSSLTPLAMRDLGVYVDLVPNLASSLPRESQRGDVAWLYALHRRALEAVNTAGRVPETTTRETDAQNEAQLQYLGWKTRLIRRDHPPGQWPLDTEQENGATTGGPTRSTEVLPDFDTDFFSAIGLAQAEGTAPVPGPAVNLAGNGTDWLEELLGIRADDLLATL